MRIFVIALKTETEIESISKASYVEITFKVNIIRTLDLTKMQHPCKSIIHIYLRSQC